MSPVPERQGTVGRGGQTSYPDFSQVLLRRYRGMIVTLWVRR